MPNIESQEILGVRVDFGLDMQDVADICEKHVTEGSGSYQVCTVNPEFVMAAQDDEEFKNIINTAFLAVPDGSGLIYAKRYLDKVGKLKKDQISPIRKFVTGIKIGVLGNKESRDIKLNTITGVELTKKICHLSSQKNYSIFFLGGAVRDSSGNPVIGQKDVSTLAADKMREKYPNVNIIGSTSDFNPNNNFDKKTLDYIHDCMYQHNINTLDFIFVACNYTMQEKWIKRNIDKIPVRIGVGIGRTFDYLSNISKTPPTITYKYNISWLYSLINEPWRFKRVLKAFPAFPIKVFLNSIKKS